MDQIRAYLNEVSDLVAHLPVVQLSRFVDRLMEAYDEGQQLFLLGNGGSAATASHLLADFQKCIYLAGGKTFRALAVTDSVPLITAWANDTHYDNVFAEQLRVIPSGGYASLGTPSDLLDRLHHLAAPALVLGLVLTAVVGSTDWVDGWLARRTGTVSRLGQLLDPLADRLLIASVAVALLVRGVLPWPAALLLLARDVVLLAGWPLLKRRGVEPPEVVWVGKAATFVLLLALPVLTLGATGMAVAPAARVLGLALLWLGVALYYLAGAVYVRMALERLGERTAAGS